MTVIDFMMLACCLHAMQQRVNVIEIMKEERRISKQQRDKKDNHGR